MGWSHYGVWGGLTMGYGVVSLWGGLTVGGLTVGGLTVGGLTVGGLTVGVVSLWGWSHYGGGLTMEWPTLTHQYSIAQGGKAYWPHQEISRCGNMRPPVRKHHQRRGCGATSTQQEPLVRGVRGALSSREMQQLPSEAVSHMTSM